MVGVTSLCKSVGDLRPIDILTGETAVEVTGVVEVSPALWYFKSSEHIVDYTSHGVGSNQFLLVNIRIIQFVSFGYYNDQKRWKKTKNIGKILPVLSFTEQ
jgi:hypothetical protein